MVHAGTDAALFAELELAYQRKAPWLGWIYTPHWAPIKFEGEWVEFPGYADACYEDPSWGENTDIAYDCGKPYGWIKGRVEGGRGEVALRLRRDPRVQDRQRDHGRPDRSVDLEGREVGEVVQEWLDANQATWQTWTACAG